MKKKDYIILVLILLIVLLIFFKNTSNTFEMITVAGSEESKGGYILLNTKTGSVWNYNWYNGKFEKVR